MRKKPQEEDEYSPADARGSPAEQQIVEQRLIRQLLNGTQSTLWLGMLVGLAVTYAIFRTVGDLRIVYWLLALLAVSIVRLFVIPPLKKRLGHEKYLSTGRIYAASALLAGTVWAALVTFDTEGNSIGVRLLVLIVLISMPVSSLSANAIFKPVFFAFSAPIYAALLYWAIWLSPSLHFEFAILAVAHTALTSVVAVRYNENLKRTIQRDIENERLMHELGLVNDELHRMAYEDPLTGLSNRRSFEEGATELLDRLRDNDKVALMLIDMDDFKWINDSLGHAAGDEALITLSRRIDENSRVNEMVAHNLLSSARIGGDEFIVIYRLNPKAPIEPLATRILEATAEPIVFGGQTYRPSVSIGIAIAPQQADSLDGLLRLADTAMYQAKAQGGGCFVIYGDDDPLSRTEPAS